MSAVMNSSSVSTASSNTPRKTQLIRSHRQLKAVGLDAKVKYLYKVRSEAPIDLVWAFAAITDAGYSYKPKDSKDDNIVFSTKCEISELRYLWIKMHKDLHVMVESLDYADDYTGERYFVKYWNAKDNDDEDAYYCSDSEEEPQCKYCLCDPSQEDHLEDCEWLACDKMLECNKKLYGL